MQPRIFTESNVHHQYYSSNMRAAPRADPSPPSLASDLRSSSFDDDKDRFPLQVSVLAHRTDGHGATYADHMFVLSVRCEPEIYYVIERSYVDFVDLDISLRKTFPGARLADLPLNGAPTVAKYLQYRTLSHETEGSRSVLTSQSHFAVPDSSTPHLVAAAMELYCRGSKENLSSKLGALNQYLKGVISMNEMVVSDAFADFISEENFSIETGERIPLIYAATEVDLLLAGAVFVDSVVKYSEHATFTVQPGQLVVWKFSTIDYDIGFSVEFNSEVKVPTTRYASHLKPVVGCLRCDAFGTCELNWDNSYSKFYNKNLRWAVRIVSSKEYEASLRKSLELQRERRRLDMQRSMIHKVLVDHAARVSGVIHGSAAQFRGVLGEEDPERQRALTEELNRVKEELKVALEERNNAKTKADYVSNRLERAEKTVETLSESTQKGRLREELLRKENEQLITENNNLTQTVEELSSEILDFEKQMAALHSRVSTFDRDMADKDAMIAKAELSAKYLRESTRVVRTAPDTLEPLAVDEADLSALLEKMASLELEASACRSAHVTLCEQLASAKSETAELAQELIEQTQREEEMRTTIDVLTDQLNAALRALGTGCSSPQASATKDSLSNDAEGILRPQVPQRPMRRHSTAEAVLQARSAALRMRYGSWDIAAPPPADDYGSNEILVAQLNSSKESYSGESATPFERNL